ncbi:MAG: PUR family DNA/RNA-binding protein [candidate division WOR-3 bacterium]|nr:PUR family DNA/RNA-binding protein [candidate division WOR-3 bacterium]MCX7947688.1 PUR family DNA/RNA-binding protein [candidate division WOR-3 bacterium]MDW8150565.1 DUF3276 family protein [candidate division WOR-3 bacterium]
MEQHLNRQNNIVYTKKIKAGRRTYFFDIKVDGKGQNYISISESRKTENGFKKQMIVIYPEDIEKFFLTFKEVKDSLK